MNTCQWHVSHRRGLNSRSDPNPRQIRAALQRVRSGVGVEAQVEAEVAVHLRLCHVDRLAAGWSRRCRLEQACGEVAITNVGQNS